MNRDTADEKEYMVSGETKSGIRYRVDSRLLHDTRFTHYAIRMKSADRLEAAKALFDMFGFLFGSPEGLLAFETEIAAKHDGICTNELLIEELNDMLGALGAKN